MDKCCHPRCNKPVIVTYVGKFYCAIHYHKLLDEKYPERKEPHASGKQEEARK